jgi:hypothetical protein
MQRPGAGARIEFFKFSMTPRVKGPALLRPRLNLTMIVMLSRQRARINPPFTIRNEVLRPSELEISR